MVAGIWQILDGLEAAQGSGSHLGVCVGLGVWVRGASAVRL